MDIQFDNFCHVWFEFFFVVNTLYMVLPGMSDGRCFTSYIPNCELNKRLMQTSNTSNNEYRSYLQTNAETLIKNTNKICASAVDKECEYCIDLGRSQN